MDENINKIADYIKKNKGAFQKQALIETLLGAGYSREDVVAGIARAYGEKTKDSAPAAKTDFWDFKNSKAYADAAEKWMDALFGFAISLLLVAVMSIIPLFGIIFFYVAEIFLIIYFANRRPFMVIGFSIMLFLGPIVYGLISEIMSGYSLFP